MMVRCEECFAEISDSAMTCPKCGAKTTFAKKLTVRLLIMLCVMGVTSIIAYCLLDELEHKARLARLDASLQSYYNSEKREHVAELGRKAADMLKTQRASSGEKSEWVGQNMRRDHTAIALPITDNVLGSEYNLKKIDGGWEVYKNDGSTVYQSMDRDRCLKYVKELRGL